MEGSNLKRRRNEDEEPPFKRTKTTSNGVYCCVVNCHSNTVGDRGKVSFHRFPKKNPQQAEAWIKAIRRIDEHGKPWRPSLYALICSKHFLNGKVAKEENSPSYVPTIFPTGHGPLKSETDERRFQRARRRLELKPVFKPESTLVQNNAWLTKSAGCNCMIGNSRVKVDVGCQANRRFPVGSLHVSSVVRSCEDGVGVQVSMFHKQTFRDASVQTAIVPSSKSVGTNTDGTSGVESKALNITAFDENTFKSFTGMGHALFNFFVFMLHSSLSPSRKLTSPQKILLFLLKIKLNLTYTVLGGIFDVNRQSASRFFIEVKKSFFNLTRENLNFFDQATIQARMPPSFRALFPNCTCIIDCSEVQIETPKTQKQKLAFFSNYKQRYTIKFLLAIAPSGEITFISQAYGGRTTDGQLTANCGFLELLWPGALVLADKGFPQINDALNNKGALLVMPPMSSKTRPFTQHENDLGYKCACVRIHVERAIARMKTFQILKFIPSNMLPHINEILAIISFICNHYPDLINQEKMLQNK